MFLNQLRRNIFRAFNKSYAPEMVDKHVRIYFIEPDQYHIVVSQKGMRDVLESALWRQFMRNYNVVLRGLTKSSIKVITRAGPTVQINIWGPLTTFLDRYSSDLIEEMYYLTPESDMYDTLMYERVIELSQQCGVTLPRALACMISDYATLEPHVPEWLSRTIMPLDRWSKRRKTAI